MVPEIRTDFRVIIPEDGGGQRIIESLCGSDLRRVRRRFEFFDLSNCPIRAANISSDPICNSSTSLRLSVCGEAGSKTRL